MHALTSSHALGRVIARVGAIASSLRFICYAPRRTMDPSPRSARRSIGSGLLASLAALAAIILVEIVLRVLPAPEEPLSPTVFLDRQGGLEEIERAVIEELKGEDPAALRANRIYLQDEETFWRLKRNATITGKNYLVPRAVRDRIPFTVTLNGDGFRGPALARTKPAGALRVIALGNSSTFGWGVDDGATYPARLAAQLGAAFPGRPIEVMNAGIPGFGSFQGKRILASEALARSPDYVVLSFGFNDSRRAATSDSAFALARARPLARAARVAGRLAIARRIERAIGAVRGRGAADRLSPGAEGRPAARVPVAEYAANMREMVAAVQNAGARPILLAMVIPQEYRDALVAIAREAPAPILDTRPFLTVRIEDEAVRGAFADEIARHEAAWKGVPAGVSRNAAYADAMHPSPIGHALIAEWVARVIQNAERLDRVGRGAPAMPSARPNAGPDATPEAKPGAAQPADTSAFK